MQKEYLTPALMTKLAKTVDHILNPTVKGETGFVIFAYPHEEGDIEALYVSNSQLNDVKKAISTWLEREDKRQKQSNEIGPPPQLEGVADHQRSMEEIKAEITRKYQGKRLKDTQHDEEFDYLESRDWQAIYHYPDRFEVVGDAIGEEEQNG